MIPKAQFWQTTRGRLVAVLRFAEHTVGDLAHRLHLTDNAVRAHLVSLERDGLVKLSGQRPGTRRPNYTYQLTNEAEHLFPKAYTPVLSQLLASLSDQLPPDTRHELIANVGRRLAEPYLAELESLPLEQRIARVDEILQSFGGSVDVVREDGQLRLQGKSCPLSAVVEEAENSAGCEIMQAMLSTMLGVPVSEHCQRGEGPRCCFSLQAP